MGICEERRTRIYRATYEYVCTGLVVDMGVVKVTFLRLSV